MAPLGERLGLPKPVGYALGFVPYLLLSLVPKESGLWVFGADGGTRFAENPKYVFLHVADSREDVTPVWISADREVVEELSEAGYTAHHASSLTARCLSVRAEMAVVSHGLTDLIWWAHGGATVVQLWHGVSFKKKRWISEKERERLSTVERLFLRYVLWRCDFVTATSSSLVEMHSRAFDVPEGNVLVTGYPRHDPLFGPVDGERLGSPDRVYDELAGTDETVVMYLPTWRDTGGNPLVNGDLDLESLGSVLDAHDARIYVKLHPKTEPDGEVVATDRITVLRTGFDIYPALRDVDVLVTDYSSVFSDFLPLDRPMLFYPYDLERFVSEDRELYFDYREYTPGPIVRDPADFPGCLVETIETDGAAYADRREAVRQELFDHVDGNASERVCEALDRIAESRA